MGSLKIIKSGILTSLQDSGRSGYAFYAIPCSGAMDIESAHNANTIVGNPIDNPVIECTLMPPTLEFSSQATIAISGASASWKINGIAINTDTIIKVKAGNVLSGSPFRNGMRSYIAISGKIEAAYYLNSCSYNSYLSSELLDLQLLKKGDIIKWEEETNEERNIRHYPLRREVTKTILLRKGPEYNTLNHYSQQLLSKGQQYKISPQSNRMGIRLNSEELKSNHPHLDHSVPVLPGMLQLIPSGQIIIILQDGQTTGGYPRIAYLTQDELSLINQIPIGKSLELILQ